MDLTQGYVLAALTALGVVLVIVIAMGRTGHRRRRLTPLGGIAFACIAAGVVFDEDRRVGYALLGTGVLVAVVDALLRLRDRT